LRWNCLLKDVTEGNIESGMKVTERQEEDLSSYWMTLGKQEDTGN
jgi:hypothetical protein